jgi:omega-amidase
MRVGLVQIAVGSISGDSAGHYAKYAKLAAAAGCNWVLFPELSDTGYNLAQPVSDEAGVQHELAEIARSNRIWIFAGICTSTGSTFYNALQVFNPEGAVAAVYRKLHLFRNHPMDEGLVFTAGTEPVLVSTGTGHAGLAICFDLRFPSLYRDYAIHGADVLVTVAAWPLARIADWTLLQRARALENQAFAIGVNLCGCRDGCDFGGSSLVCDPEGRILANGDDREERLIICDLDLARVRQARDALPVFHRPAQGA